MKKFPKLFILISEYCDVFEILMLAKVQDFGRYKKKLKKQLKLFLYEVFNILIIFIKGLSTQKRIEYWRTIGRIKEKIAESKSLYSSLLKKKSKSEIAISLDITRTYPSLDFFKYGMKGYDQLFRVLKGISLTFPKVGYCQGMNFFSAIILLIMGNEEESFYMVAFLLNRYKFSECLSTDLSRIKVTCYQLDCLVQVYLPDLHIFLVIFNR